MAEDSDAALIEAARKIVQQLGFLLSPPNPNEDSAVARHLVRAVASMVADAALSRDDGGARFAEDAVEKIVAVEGFSRNSRGEVDPNMENHFMRVLPQVKVRLQAAVDALVGVPATA